MAFEFAQKVLFKHCDPAGIVFYPRYFEMMNDCVEAFFAQIGAPFEEIHRDGAVPMAQISTRFTAPSRHGDHLVLTLKPVRLGNSSLTIQTQATCGDALRFETEATLVYVAQNGRPTPWPDTIHRALLPFLEGTDDLENNSA